MTRYIAHQLTHSNYRTFFTQVNDQIHVSAWRGDGLLRVDVLSKEAARQVWRQMTTTRWKVAQSSTVSPLFHGISCKHLPTPSSRGKPVDADPHARYIDLMKVSPTVAHAALASNRRARALSACLWGVYGVRADGALYAKESSAHCDERAAVAKAADMARLNPGKAFVAAPLEGYVNRERDRAECF